MNHSFEYIDIILLAMIAGIIFLRLRGILGRKTGHEKNLDAKFSSNFQAEKNLKEKLNKFNFDEEAKNDFLKGAQIAYERIITDFASGNLKNIKSLLAKKVFDTWKVSKDSRSNNPNWLLTDTQI